MLLLLALAIFAAVEVGTWLMGSLWLMLAIGDIHRNWWPAVPLMGWHAALPIAFCLTSFVSVAVAGVVGCTSHKK